MDKNNSIQHNILSKSNIALICVLIAIFGFIFSRAFLSFGIFTFGINALRDVHPRRWIKNKWWLAGVLWIAIYAVSWFWTDDKANWSERFDVKLPILLLPLAFAYIPAFTIKQLKVFTIFTGIILLVNVGYSLYFYFQNPGSYIYGYSVSHGLPTLTMDDHIRISLFIALFIVWCFYFFKYASASLLRWVIIAVVAILVLYLHILAARTGLLALYTFVALHAVYISISKSRVVGISLIILLVAAGVFSYNYFPTLRNKIGYFEYTVIEYQRTGLQGHYSDMGRLISYDIALKLIKQNLAAGVGAGDVNSEMQEGYKRWYPDVNKEDRLMPHNQFMIVTLGCGIAALLVFITWVLMPLRNIKKSRSGFYFFSVWLILLIPLMIEPMLEIQFGVFVYLFFLLWQRHFMINEPVRQV